MHWRLTERNTKAATNPDNELGDPGSVPPKTADRNMRLQITTGREGPYECQNELAAEDRVG
jgi:hypothetical protein